MTPERIEQEIIQLRDQVKDLTRKINDYRCESYNADWRMRQSIDGHETVLGELRNVLNPILENSIWDSHYLENKIADIDKTKEISEEAHGLISYNMSNIDNLQKQMNEFSNAIAQMGVNAELVSQTLTEMCERLQQLETPPTEDRQEDRQPDSKDDLEIFDQIEEKDETPIIRFDDNEWLQRPIMSEADYFIRTGGW